ISLELSLLNWEHPADHYHHKVMGKMGLSFGQFYEAQHHHRFQIPFIHKLCLEQHSLASWEIRYGAI
ncbi:unnamed protein product, partial [Sphenostylis stenocarpa]